MSNKKITKKHVSILKEGERLYRYECAAWYGGDFASQDNNIKNCIGYLIYESGDTIKNIFYNSDLDKCFIDVSFYKDDFKYPIKTLSGERNLNSKELELVKIKQNLINKVYSDTNFQIVQYKDFNLNFQLLPNKKGYSFYILSGTSKPNVIPFGNDWVFNLNKKGEIKSWRKYHSVLIPAYISDSVETTTVFHSHLDKEPFVTPTDICTFKLYAPIFGVKNMYIYSPGVEKWYLYGTNMNSIIVLNKDFFEKIEASLEERKKD
ncbi:MAG: hypothetical protein PHN41_06385 [Bacteroidales bacterium]|nr:hypothetical protein [Bacteroidales bacterium]MDD4704037.1 hypothetical protein [Bacteroidales bacterium]